MAQDSTYFQEQSQKHFCVILASKAEANIVSLVYYSQCISKARPKLVPFPDRHSPSPSPHPPHTDHLYKGISSIPSNLQTNIRKLNLCSFDSGISL